MTPKTIYQQYLSSGKYQADENQAVVVDHLEKIFLQLTHKKSFLEKIKDLFKRKKMPAKGLYLWGGVGIGKTWLMDLFESCLPKAMQYRRHFHAFMQQIHQELKQLQGHADPLNLIAKKIAKQTDVLCFDEFFVSDIADAMILARLLEALFAEGVSLITTANLAPDELYKNGLQRENFLPAIELIKKNTEVIYLPTQTDYRLRNLMQAGIYYYPLDQSSQEAMRHRFEELSGERSSDQDMILIGGRPIPIIRAAHGIVWFNFEDLCNIPRSQNDYVDLARRFHTVLVSNVRAIQPKQDNIAIYFIYLVDILYDHKTKLIISADVGIEDLYLDGRFAFEFQRTKSRLTEMQSLEYLQTLRVYEEKHDGNN